MVGANPPGVLVSSQVMDIQGDHMIGPDGLEQSGNITRCNRVARFALSVLAGVTEVRDNGGNTFGRRIAQSAQEKEQAAELVVHALLGIAMQRLNDKSVL